MQTRDQYPVIRNDCPDIGIAWIMIKFQIGIIAAEVSVTIHLEK
jgi:hypothetical protein